MDSLNYEKDLEIDHNNLDVAWVEQPSLLMKYAKGKENESRILDRAKEKVNIRREEIDRVRAQMDLKIRKDPKKYISGTDKITESVITSTVVDSPELAEAQERYHEAVEDMNDAFYKYRMYHQAVKAMEHKRSALENLVRLLIAGYFAGPRVPRDLDVEMARRDRPGRAEEKIKQRRKSGK